MDIPKAGLMQHVFAWALAHFNARYEASIDGPGAREQFQNCGMPALGYLAEPL
jgi:hypothetical protein